MLDRKRIFSVRLLIVNNIDSVAVYAIYDLSAYHLQKAGISTPYFLLLLSAKNSTYVPFPRYEEFFADTNLFLSAWYARVYYNSSLKEGIQWN